MALINRDEAAGRFTALAFGSLRFAAGGDAAPQAVPDPELTERPKRRSFSAEYKLKIPRQADAADKPGELGALLRREGLYSSHISTWRRRREEGAPGALGRKRGRKGADPIETENAELRRRAERAEAEPAKARKVIEVQGNVSALLEDLLGTEGAEGSTGR